MKDFCMNNSCKWGVDFALARANHCPDPVQYPFTLVLSAEISLDLN